MYRKSVCMCVYENLAERKSYFSEDSSLGKEFPPGLFLPRLTSLDL